MKTFNNVTMIDNTMTEIDDSFYDWIADPLSEDAEYDIKSKELKKDWRSTKPHRYKRLLFRFSKISIRG